MSENKQTGGDGVSPATEKASYVLREGWTHGKKHIRLRFNNQDSVITQSIHIPATGKTYHIGLLADGCTGLPGVTHTEMGAHLNVIFSLSRIQDLICAGVPIAQIPDVLYELLKGYLSGLVKELMPRETIWTYPIKIKGREDFSSQTRLKTDYLAATLLGFISDETTLVTFYAGDGVIMINDEVQSIDQHDKPDYPIISLNKAGSGFVTKEYDMEGIERVLVGSDGLKEKMPEKAFRDGLFGHQPGSASGLRTFLNLQSDQDPHLLGDDCSAVTLQKVVKATPNP